MNRQWQSFDLDGIIQYGEGCLIPKDSKKKKDEEIVLKIPCDLNKQKFNFSNIGK